MHPFWNAIVNLYPMWLAPNVLTFVGFLCLIANFILFSIYDYNFYGYCKNELNCSESLMKQNYELFKVETNLNYSKISSYLCSCIPPLLWLMGAIFQFLSHHLDGTDGKQARRTKTSSPLGELFDHGLDSWATLFLPVSLYSMFGRNEFGASVLDMYFILWTIMGIFLISHWEKYNTGVLFLPWSYDLAQIVIYSFFFFSVSLNT
jgi:ethanolaminephosphotransferase